LREGEQLLRIGTDWRGVGLDSDEIATVGVSIDTQRLTLSIDSPYAGDPRPPGAPGPTEGLWEYEVVELFLANRDSERYLEIEVSPHGHYLILTFDGIRNRVGTHSAECSTQITNDRWHGVIHLDAALVPSLPLRANAYRICGTESDRRYLAAYPVPGEEPDFHRLDRFRDLG